MAAEQGLANLTKDKLSVVKSYMYDEFVDGESPEMDGMGKLNFDDLIIGK